MSTIERADVDERVAEPRAMAATAVAHAALSGWATRHVDASSANELHLSDEHSEAVATAERMLAKTPSAHTEAVATVKLPASGGLEPVILPLFPGASAPVTRGPTGRRRGRPRPARRRAAARPRREPPSRAERGRDRAGAGAGTGRPRRRKAEDDDKSQKMCEQLHERAANFDLLRADEEVLLARKIQTRVRAERRRDR